MWKKAKTVDPPLNPSKKGTSGPGSNHDNTQLSDPDGVNSDVSSLAVNHGLLAVGVHPPEGTAEAATGLSYSETGTTPDLADKTPHVEEEILRRERLAAIRQKVEALPERQKLAVLMHKYQEMDYRQIAEVLKLSESATKSLLFRAYETLRTELKEFV